MRAFPGWTVLCRGTETLHTVSRPLRESGIRCFCAPFVFPPSVFALLSFHTEADAPGNRVSRKPPSGLVLDTVYISCFSSVWSYIQCIFCVEALFSLTYSVYFVLQSCFILHTVYISCFSSVWSYIQCIFHVSALFGLTYSVYFLLQFCLVLHTVYIIYCSPTWCCIHCR